VAQRGTSSTGQTSAGYKTCDRFNTFISSAGTWTITQSTDAPDGFSNSIKYDCTTASASLASGARMDHQQRFEGQDLQHLAKGTSEAVFLTLSFWVKSNKTGTYIVELFDNDNSRQISQEYSIGASDTWEHKTLTFAGDASGALGNDNGNSFQVNWFLVAGTDLSSGTLNTSWASSTSANRAVGQVNLADDTANEWYLTGVQLEVGTVATPFEHRSFGEELALCQRYYERWERADSLQVGMGHTYSTGASYGVIAYTVTKRAAPSGSSSSGTWRLRSGGTNYEVTTTIALFNISEYTARFSFSGNGASTGSTGWVVGEHSNAFIAFDAEL